MPASLNIVFDLSREKAEAEAKMSSAMRSALTGQITDFFRGSPHDKTKQGSGYKEVDELITNRFLSPDFQRKVHKYFDDSWERMFQEVMTKRLEHLANQMVTERLETIRKEDLAKQREALFSKHN